MIEVEVRGNLENALRSLKKRMDVDGILRDLKRAAIPGKAERRKLKAHVALMRRIRNQSRRARYAEGGRK